MYSEEELIKVAKQKGIECYDAIFNDDEINMITVHVNFDELINFAKERNIKEVFYKFDYSSAEVLSITDETIRKTMARIDVPYKEICEIIEAKINEYNNKVEKLDFSKPHALTVFCIYQGHKIGIFETDLWFFDEGVMFPEDALKTIVAENNELVKEYVIQKEAESIKIKEEFHQYLLNDEEFHKCTNSSLRTSYVMKLYKDEKHKNFKNAFIKGTDYQRYNEYAEFVDMVWREYKEDLKKKKNNPYLNSSK